MKRREFIQSLSAAALAMPVVANGLARFALSDEKKDKIKIGQIGTAHAHASGKLATIRKFADEYELIGVVEPDPERRAQCEKDATYSGVTWLSETELFDTAGLQAVAVETAVRDLLPTAARCVQAGLHIHLDKPAGESLPDFKKILDTATSKNRVVQMGYMFRYNPAFQFLFRAVRAGWLGDVFEIHAVMSKAVGDGQRKQLAEFPGGSMFELGCHVIDAVVAVLGKPDKVTAFNRNTRPDKDTLADNCLAVFEYPKATATVRSSLVEVDGGNRRQFVVCGSQGTVAILPLEPPQLQLTLDRPQGELKQGTQTIDLPKLDGRYDGDFIDLAKIIRREKKSDYPPGHDLAVQEAVLRASGVAVD